MRLTKRAIDGMEYDGDGKSRDVRWDDTLPGFGIRIYPTGRKAFVISYRVNGRKRLMTIKDRRVLTLDNARTKARKLLANLDEVDPLEARQRNRRGTTIRDLRQDYIERHAKIHKKTWEKDNRRLERHIKPVWDNHQAKVISKADIAGLHHNVGKKSGPYEANRLLEILAKMFELAIDWGYLDDDAGNPARKIKKFREEKRDRWVTPEELPLLAEAIDRENPHTRAALWLYLLTGLRKTELLTSKWEHLDLDRKELALQDTKAGRKHYVPLSEPALAILRDLPRLEGNPYILPGYKEGRSLVNIEKPWSRVRDRATVSQWADHSDEKISALVAELTEKLRRAPTCGEVRAAATFNLPPGIDDVRLHDLRRTVGSWLAQAGNSLHLIGRVLNHSNQSTTAVYARFGQDQVRQALEQHAERIMGAAGKQSPAEVVKIKG